MSKLSEPLKALINAAHARPNTIPAPRSIASVYDRIATDATAKQVGLPAWLTASTAATMTLNSPDSLLELYRTANQPKHARSGAGSKHSVWTAELMREIGLKCIGLNGVPRTINCLGAFYGGLPAEVQSALRERPARRQLGPDNIAATLARGDALWDSIYRPFSDKLTAKLAQSHPDMPVFIIQSEYGSLFADPPSSSSSSSSGESLPNVGRVLMSVAAVACLRAQTGVAPQVVSHIFGLRKAFEDGSAEAEPVEGGRWLASNEGSVWLLEQIDRVVAAVGAGQGTTFAPGYDAAAEPKAKL